MMRKPCARSAGRTLGGAVLVLLALWALAAPAGADPKKDSIPALDAHLQAIRAAYLASQPEVARQQARELGIAAAGDQVKVVIELQPGHGAPDSAIAGIGGTVTNRHRHLVQALVPVQALDALAALPGVRYVRPPFALAPTAVTSDGVALIKADLWQTTGFTGAGVKVAVVDLGFSGYTAKLGTELPASVVARSFRSDGDITGGGQVHGTACAETVHDVAPDATLYLVNFSTEVELGNAVTWLIGQGVKVISFSIGFLNTSGPGDGTGVIADIVADATAAGILWASSAGNYAQTHWAGPWSNPDHDEFHNFPSADETNPISASAGQIVTVGLRWNDPWGTSTNDYDLYVYDNALNLVAKSEGGQNGTQDPTEFVQFVAPATGTYRIRIARFCPTLATCPAPVDFDLMTFSHVLTYQVPAGSITIPADTPQAYAAGAANVVTDTIEVYSSRGPTVDGRLKPDISAPDNTINSVYGRFAGTSAAAPHLAGAAAVVLSAFPAYAPADVRAFLDGRAIDKGVAGPDNIYGVGRLSLGNPPTTAVTITTSPAGLQVTLDGQTLTAPQAVTWGTGVPHSVGTPSPQLSPNQQTRYVYASWSDGGAQTHTITTPAAATTYTASFATQYLLTLAASPAGGGSVGASPGGPWYAAGVTVQLTATPSAGYVFTGWSGDCSGTANPLSVPMDAAKSCTASFAVAPCPTEVIVDNLGPGQSDAQRSFVGTWATSSTTGAYGANGSLYSNGAGLDSYTWKPAVFSQGQACSYQVFAWWTYHVNRSTAVPYVIVGGSAGPITVTVNQQNPALNAKWNPLGTITFPAGAQAAVTVSDPNGQANADAVRFVLSTPDATPPDTSITGGPTGTVASANVTFTWTGTDDTTPTGSLQYAYRLDPLEPSFSAFGPATTRSYSNLPSASYTFLVKARDATGNEDLSPAARAFAVDVSSTCPAEVIVDNLAPGQADAQHTFTGTWATSGATGAYGANGSLYSNGAGLDSYTWKPTVFSGTQACTYQVLAWWTYHVNRSSAVPYLISGGSTGPVTVTVNQLNSTLGSKWNPLAIVTFPAGAQPTVTISDPNGQANADAVRFVLATDGTPPDTSITGGPTGTITSPSAAFTWTGADDTTPTASLQYAYRLDPLEPAFSAFGPATGKSYSSLANGAYTFLVKARDTVGNEDSTPASRAFTVSVSAGCPSEIIVDNLAPGQSDGQRSFTGTWATSGTTGAFGANGSLYSNGAALDTYTWKPAVFSQSLTCTYQVFAWWTYHVNRSSAVPYAIAGGSSGTVTVTVNQLNPALNSTWNALATVSFPPGAQATVTVSDPNGQASADAVRFLLVP